MTDEVTCLGCTRSFIPSSKHPNQQYCSHKCWLAELQYRKPKSVCDYCHETFGHPPSRSPQYCSTECQKAALRLARTRYCVFCEELFETPPHKPNKYCSQRCAHAHRTMLNRQDMKEPPPIDGCRWIPLSNGAFTLVNVEDYNRLAKFTWSFGGDGYAHSRINGRLVKMHALLLGPIDGEADHANRHRLDNRRCNLRVATHSQNRANSTISRNNTSGFKGVHEFRSGKWMARIGVQHRRIYLGLHSTPEQAARAYDEAARKHFGEYAACNFDDAANLEHLPKKLVNAVTLSQGFGKPEKG